MPRFINLTPSTNVVPEPAKEIPQLKPSVPPSVPPLTLKPAVKEGAVAVEQTVVADQPESKRKMRILIIDSERCLAYIFRSCLAGSYDVRVDSKISGDYDMLICHENDLAGQTVDMGKVRLAGKDLVSPIRSREVSSVVRTYQLSKGF